VCVRDGVVYHVHSNIWTALRAHTRWLRAMGVAPAA
jgi:hypothetical protein